MTVKELIEALQKVDPDRVVVVADDDSYFEVVKIRDDVWFSSSDFDIFEEQEEPSDVPCVWLDVS
jgi:hypothetical protein